MKRLAPLAIVGALASLTLTPAHAITLEEVIAAADSPLVDAAEARRNAADARLDQARSARWPQLSARGQYAWAETDFGAGRQEIEPRSGALVAEQLIFSGGRVWASVRQARAGLRAQEAETAGVRAALAADIADAYLGALNTARALAFHQANFDAVSTLAQHARLRFDSGEIPRSALAQAEARRAAAQAALAQARADAEAARSRFVRVTGMTAENLTPVDAPPPTPERREDAIAQASAANPQLMALREAEIAADAGIWRAAAQHAPTVTVGLEANSIRDEFLPGYRAEGTAVVARASIPLFTGGRITGEVREARAAHAETRAMRIAAERAIVDEVTQAFENHRAAHEAEIAARAQVEAAQSARDSIRDEAQVGQRPTIDVLDAERDLLEAQLAFDRAHAAAIVSAYRLNALLGAPAEAS